MSGGWWEYDTIRSPMQSVHRRGDAGTPRRGYAQRRFRSGAPRPRSTQIRRYNPHSPATYKLAPSRIYHCWDEGGRGAPKKNRKGASYEAVRAVGNEWLRSPHRTQREETDGEGREASGSIRSMESEQYCFLPCRSMQRPGEVILRPSTQNLAVQGRVVEQFLDSFTGRTHGTFPSSNILSDRILAQSLPPLRSVATCTCCNVDRVSRT
jgi:hypothetical protein